LFYFGYCVDATIYNWSVNYLGDQLSILWFYVD